MSIRAKTLSVSDCFLLLTLADLRYLDHKNGALGTCACCAATIPHTKPYALAIISIKGDDARWGHTICSQCRMRTGEQILRGIAERTLIEIQEHPDHLSEFQMALLNRIPIPPISPHIMGGELKGGNP